MYFVQVTESFTTEEVTSKVKELVSCAVVCGGVTVWNGAPFVQLERHPISFSIIYSGLTVFHISGLLADQVVAMEVSLRNSKINFSRRQDQECIEAETSGVTILNILGEFGYKIYGQSMAIEETGIGGRTILVQRIVWTMGK